MLKKLSLLLLCGSLHSATIGIENHNPGNIISYDYRQWHGATGTDEWGHLVFPDDEHGLIAIRRVLRAYYYKHKIRNVSGIVNRWVRRPKTEAEIQAVRNYILCVCQRAKVKPNQRLWLNDNEMMASIAKAIVFAENSSDPYPEDLYKKVFKY